MLAGVRSCTYAGSPAGTSPANVWRSSCTHHTHWLWSAGPTVPVEKEGTPLEGRGEQLTTGGGGGQGQGGGREGAARPLIFTYQSSFVGLLAIWLTRLPLNTSTPPPLNRTTRRINCHKLRDIQLEARRTCWGRGGPAGGGGRGGPGELRMREKRRGGGKKMT